MAATINDRNDNWNVSLRRDTAKGIHKASRFSQALFHESFMSKWWLSFKIETWNFIKNQL